jgi:6-phosphogluconolactonase
MPAYIGTYTGDSGSKGIYRIWVDREKGIVSKPELVAEVDNPSFLAFGRVGGKWLYAVSESRSKVFAYSGADGDGTLTLLNEMETGAGPCHVALNAFCFLAVANYGGGSVNAWKLGGDGRIGEQMAFFQNTHASKATDRQQRPHAHGVTFSPCGRWLLVPDLGADRVYVYQRDVKGEGIQPHETAPWIELPPGRGPRHVEFLWGGLLQNKDYLYVLNELSNTVSVFECDREKGLFTFVEEASTLPKEFDGRSTSAELIVLNRTVYTTNRGHDSIARFQRDPKTGRLTLVECVPCGGKWPRHFTIMPGESLMLVANQHSNNIAVFRIGKDGALTPMPDAGTGIGAPACVVF